MNGKILSILVIFGIMMISVSVFAVLADDWPMFHHDLSLSGVTTSSAPDTNNTLWIYQTGGRIESSPAVVGNKVYIGSQDNNLYCLNKHTGALICNFSTGNMVQSSPAVSHGKVYFLSSDGKVYALNANDCSLIWNATIGPGSWDWSSPAVHNGYVFIGGSTINGTIYSLDANNGSVIWSTVIGAQSDSPIAVANGKVYSGTHNFNANAPTLVALNETTGAIIWIYNYTVWHPGVVGMVNDNGAAVVDGDGDGNLEVYFGVYNWNGVGPQAICLDEATGNEIWAKSINGDSTSTPAVHNGRVFIGSDDGNLYALNATNGNYIWNYSTGDQVWSAPAVSGDGKVCFTSLDHTIYCVDEITGALIWSYYTGASRIISSPAIANGMLFIGNENGNVYAFADEKATEEKTTDVTVENAPPYIEWQNENWSYVDDGTLVIKCAVACDNNSVDDIVDVEGYIYDPSGMLIDHEYLMLAQNNSTCWQMVDEQDPDFYDKYMIGICDLYEGNYTLPNNATEGPYNVTIEVNDTSGEYGNMTNYFNYTSKNLTPFIEWMWVLPDEDNFTNGTQVYPEPGGSKTVTKCVIACDPNGIGTIVDVEAEVYYPNGTLKEHEHLTPAINNSMCWQTVPPEDIEFWDKYNQGICDIYDGNFTMEFWEPPGDYLVAAEVHDTSGLHGHMNDTFEYMPCIAIDNDATLINFGSIVPGSSSNVTGDNDMATLNAPTLRNICNVPANISVMGTNLSCTTPATCNAAAIPVPIIGFDVGVYNCPIPGTYGAPTLPIEPGPMSTNLENFQLNVPLGTLSGSYQGSVMLAGIQG